MKPECDDQVRLFKSGKIIGAGGWRLGNLFEAADLGDCFSSSAHHQCSRFL